MVVATKAEKPCFVYWIKASHHTDIFTEGYIGVSQNVNNRYTQHKQWARSGKRTYSSAFKIALNELKTECITILCASRKYCLDIEQRLRPEQYTGWNRAVGGEGTKTSVHGLSGTAEARTLRNLRHRAKLNGMEICQEWSGPTGVQNFADFYSENLKGSGKQVCLPHSGVVGPTTVLLLDAKERLQQRYRVHSVGTQVYNVAELGRAFGIKPNTIVCRLNRGWSLTEACELEPRQKQEVVVAGTKFSYSGAWGEDRLLEFKNEYESGSKLTELAVKYNQDPSHLSRLAKKFNFVRPTATDFFGNEVMVGVHGKLGVSDYALVKELLLQNKSCTEITQIIDVSASTVSALIKKLNWREYARTMA